MLIFVSHLDQLNALFFPIGLVGAIEDLDPGVSLLHKGPVIERSVLWNVVPVMFAMLQCFIDRGKVICHLFGNAADNTSIAVAYEAPFHSPNIDAATSGCSIINDAGFCPVPSRSSPCSARATATTSDDNIIIMLCSGCHPDRGARELSPEA